MPGMLARFLDTTLAGGKLITPSTDVFANGKPIVLFPCKILPHPPYKGLHKVSVTKSCSTTVFANGRPVQKTLDSTICGHPVFMCSTDIIVG